MRKIFLFFTLLVSLFAIISCDNESDYQTKEGTLRGRKFYHFRHSAILNRDSYYCIEFLDQSTYTFYETNDKFFMCTDADDLRKGTYKYYPSNKSIVFDNSVSHICYGPYREYLKSGIYKDSKLHVYFRSTSNNPDDNLWIFEER